MALTVSKRGRVNEGRPTAYRPEYARQCFHLCKLGAIDEALGLFFGVSERTINTWKHEHPDFLAAMKRGKAFADAQVAVALYNCAIGFEHPAEKLFADPKTGGVIRVPYTKRYPPNVQACIFWLTNRHPDLWRK